MINTEESKLKVNAYLWYKEPDEWGNDIFIQGDLIFDDARRVANKIYCKYSLCMKYLSGEIDGKEAFKDACRKFRVEGSEFLKLVQHMEVQKEMLDAYGDMTDSTKKFILYTDIFSFIVEYGLRMNEYEFRQAPQVYLNKICDRLLPLLDKYIEDGKYFARSILDTESNLIIKNPSISTKDMVNIID
jgi:hypothetical protein